LLRALLAVVRQAIILQATVVTVAALRAVRVAQVVGTNVMCVGKVEI